MRLPVSMVFSKIAMLGRMLAATLLIPLVSEAARENVASVPKAVCGPQDNVEIVQGQITLGERFRSGSPKPYNCNLELVGQYEAEGTAGFMVTFNSCVYYSTWPNRNVKNPGVTVLDVSDSRHPKATDHLDGPAMLNANESLAIDPARKLLFANRFNSTIFDVYDLSVDCRHPILKSSMAVPRAMSHIGQLAPDGRTLYGASCCAGFNQYPLDPGIPPSAIFAIDTANSSALREIATWIPSQGAATHAVSVNEQGSRAYVSVSNGGFFILDVADIQERRRNAQFRLISSLLWDDSLGGQIPLPITIEGRRYIVLGDTVGAAIGASKASCISGTKPGHGFARIIDISDESNPKIVSKLMLEVSLPANCSKVRLDPVVAMGYGSVFCDVDDRKDAKLLACGYFEGGVRVFDIRDPTHPKEIGYYKPAAPRTQIHPASITRNLLPGSADQTADQVWFATFRNSGQEIWFVSSARGFHAVRFSDRFQALNPELF